MISFERSYKSSDGEFHATITDAQEAELILLLQGVSEVQPTALRAICFALVEKKESVLNILTTTDTSRPKARKANGATRKPRTPKTAPETKQTSMGTVEIKPEGA